MVCYLALPFVADRYAISTAKTALASHCENFVEGLPLQSSVGGIALLNAPIPRNFRFGSTTESAGWQDWDEREFEKVFDKVWSVSPLYSSLDTKDGSLSCDSYDNAESCIQGYAGGTTIHRFTKTRVRFQDFPDDLYANYTATRVRLWQLVDTEARVIGIWSSLEASKNAWWRLFAPWSNAELYVCRTDNQSYDEWIETIL